MSYSTEVARMWRHTETGTDPRSYLELVRYATLAASSHNTQPWKFELKPGSITILPDLSRRCSAVDPDDHHLYASLGCAAENLLLAAQAAGLDGTYRFDAATTSVRVDFNAATPKRSPLFQAILNRQCSRVEYDGKPLSTETLRHLESAGRGNGVSVSLLTNAQQKDAVTDYVTRGNTTQFADAAWAAELKSWTRFNARDAIRAGDGLYGPVMGNPDVPRWVGELFMRFAFSSKSQNRKDTRNIRSSAAIAVIHSEADDVSHWIEAGRCYERLALQAAVLNLRTAFINQPVEVAALRPDFARYLGIGNRRPDLIVRIGQGPETLRSLRRPVEQVIVSVRGDTLVAAQNPVTEYRASSPAAAP